MYFLNDPDLKRKIKFPFLFLGFKKINEPHIFIILAEIRTLLKWNIRKKLDERILEENIGMASIINLERFVFFPLILKPHFKGNGK